MAENTEELLNPGISVRMSACIFGEILAGITDGNNAKASGGIPAIISEGSYGTLYREIRGRFSESIFEKKNWKECLKGL